MATHYVNPNDEPRECQCCRAPGDADYSKASRENCPMGCNAGRLGNPEAPKIETYWACLNSGEQFWQWRLSTPGASFGLGWSAPEYTTEAAAVAAARKALAPLPQHAHDQIDAAAKEIASRIKARRTAQFDVAEDRDFGGWAWRERNGVWNPDRYATRAEAERAARAALGAQS